MSAARLALSPSHLHALPTAAAAAVTCRRTAARLCGQRRALLPRPAALGPAARGARRGMTSPAAAAAGGGGSTERQAFAGSSALELRDWLAAGGIEVASFGQASAKSLEQLWEEVEAGETRLFLEGGRPLREVAVLNVLLRNARGQTLYEEEQVLPNGNRRVRGLPLSEKLLPGEAWQEAVVRGVVEELGPILPPNPQVEVDEASMVESVETKQSQSYPGLLSKYVCKRVSARVVDGLPEGAFTTDEERSDGLLRHCWAWRES